MRVQDLTEHVLQSAPDAIVISDAAGRIVFVNRQVDTLFGYGEELLGRPIEQLLPQRLHARHRDHREQFAEAPRTRPMGAGRDLLARRRDGTEFPVEVSLSPIEEGGERLIVAAIRDATDRRRADRELILAREEAERARQAADEARASADQANQAKSRFLSTASHDLRQPVQSIALLNGTLRRLVKAADALEVLTQQEQAIGAMSRLLNALLDISKLESGQVRPEITDFSVASLFDELRQEFASVALAKGIELQVEPCQGTIRSDPSLLEQVLRNLVANAIKYTHRGRVRLCCLPEPAQVRLEVTDTGVGIAADQLPYIFDEFFQIGARSNRERSGYGLGLSIVSRIVKLLGLRLEVNSEPGVGSSFRLAVPAGGADRGGACTPPPWEAIGGAPSQPLSPRVLLVEDDEAVRNAIRMLLEAAGYRVAAAASRAEALERIEEQPRLELIITDFHLAADGTGVQVIESARTRLGEALPAILLSGDTSAGLRNLERGGRWRLANKPIQAEQLLALMGELLGR